MLPLRVPRWSGDDPAAIGRCVSAPPFVVYPPVARRERWAIRGGHRAVVHAGMVEAESWAVLVPGFTGSKEDFIALWEPLAAAGVGVVAFDQLGQYESDGSDDPRDYALDSLAADLGEVVATAASRLGRSDPPHLVGHSFGGLVAQQAVIDGAVRPASLVALCTGPGALPEERWGELPALIDALGSMSLGDLWQVLKVMESAVGVEPPRPAVDDFLRARWLGNSPVQLRCVARLLMEQPSLTDRLRPIVAGGLPTTVMWGESDDAWPIGVQQEMAVRLGAPAVELPGTGHSPNVDRPDVLVAALLRAWRG